MLLNGIFEIFLGISCLSIVVLIHEGGHYIVARMLGVDVETFSVGFGPRLLGMSKYGTDFRLSLIPLGGYCRFSGESQFRAALENDDDFIPDLRANYFYNTSPLSKIFISFSGPMANILLGLFLFFLIYLIGYQESYIEPRIVLISELNEDTQLWPADLAGLESGDYIIEIEGKAIDSFKDLRINLSLQEDKDLNIKIKRNNKILNKIITPTQHEKRNVAVIGVAGWVDTVIDDLIKGSAAEKARLMPNDQIIEINGHKTPNISTLKSIIRKLPAAKSVNIVVQRSGMKKNLVMALPEDLNHGIIFHYPLRKSEKMNFLQAIVKSSSRTLSTFNSTVQSIGMIFRGNSKFSESVFGPIRIISTTGAALARGFKHNLSSGAIWAAELMALISLSLSFLNLLPIPILDGGQILLFSIETLHGRTFRAKHVYRYQIVGTIIILILAFAAFTGDLIHIIRG